MLCSHLKDTRGAYEPASPLPTFPTSWWYCGFKRFGLFLSFKQSLKNDCSLIIRQKVSQELRDKFKRKPFLYWVAYASQLGNGRARIQIQSVKPRLEISGSWAMPSVSIRVVFKVAGVLQAACFSERDPELGALPPGVSSVSATWGGVVT